MVATRESAALAEKLIAATCAAQGITAGSRPSTPTTVPSMTSKPVTFLLADLGVIQSHSQPHVPDDNPVSESQFKTLTTIIVTAAWACTPPPTSTTGRPQPSVPGEPAP